MKKSILVLFAVACSFAPLRAETAGLSTASPVVSGPFDVSVYLTGVFDAPHDNDAIFGYGFNVIYDNTVLTFLGADAGPLFVPVFPGDVDVAGLVPEPDLFLLPGMFTEPLQLAILHFGLAGQGNFGPTSISVVGDPAYVEGTSTNPNQGAMYLPGDNDVIRASLDVTAAPEPGTLALGALGALALAATRLRRRAA
jgi:hypothetical protein